MTEDMLRAVLDTAQAKSEKDGGAALPEGRHLTLYCAHNGVALTVSKVEHVRLAQGIVRARNGKNETFVLALEDVFSAAIDGGTEAAAARKAGFLG
jgi:hypothetical protein